MMLSTKTAKIDVVMATDVPELPYLRANQG
jgi:hypothetical protein